VLKRIGDNELVQAIDRVSKGESMLDPAMTATVFAEMRKINEAQHTAAFADLTPQELAVLKLVAQGLTNRQIAVKLYLGEGTVRNYVSSILGKIGVSNRAEAAAYAVKNKINELVPPDDKRSGK
jgi:DNA-binding NarL/FixJ family response regulator